MLEVVSNAYINTQRYCSTNVQNLDTLTHLGLLRRGYLGFSGKNLITAAIASSRRCYQRVFVLLHAAGWVIWLLVLALFHNGGNS
jgi:hypothetical protein